VKTNDYTAIIILGMITGISSALSIEPFNLPLFAWISLWPLFYMADRFKNSWTKLFLAGASASFFLCLFAFYWVIYMFSVFGGIHWTVSTLLFIPYTLLLNLKFPLFMILFGIARRNQFKKHLPPGWFTAAAIALILDFTTPQVFDWYWGNLLAGNIFLAQIAEITGIYGLTFLLFAADYALFYRLLAIRRIFIHFFSSHSEIKFKWNSVLFHRRSWKRLHTHLRIWPSTGLLIFALLFGIYRKHYFETYQENLPSVRVALLQPNTPLERPGGKQVLTKPFIENIIANTIPELAEKAWKASEGRLDLIILPESSVPYYSTQDTIYTRTAGIYNELYDNTVKDLAVKYKSGIFLNEIAVEVINSGGKLYPVSYNASAFYTSGGIRSDTYYKRVLVAFGEYIPGFQIIDALGLSVLLPDAIRYIGFQRGKTSNAIQLSMPELNEQKPEVYSGESFPYSFIPLICYEVLFPEHVRSFFNEKQKPEFMVNITQDGWYGDTAETYQHYELGRIRSIEFRKALVRSTNSGSSGFVDLAGNYAEPLHGSSFSPLFEPYVQVADVPVDTNHYRTLYERFGNLWIAVILLMFAGHVIFHFFRRKLYAKK